MVLLDHLIPHSPNELTQPLNSQAWREPSITKSFSGASSVLQKMPKSSDGALTVFLGLFGDVFMVYQ